MVTDGVIHAIFDAAQITERFRKREFVLEMSGSKFPQYVLFQLTGDRCEAADNFKVGDSVSVEFSLRGREWTSPKGEVKYFNSLDVWEIKRADERDDVPPPTEEPPPPTEEPPPFDDVPF